MSSEERPEIIARWLDPESEPLPSTNWMDQYANATSLQFAQPGIPRYSYFILCDGCLSHLSRGMSTPERANAMLVAQVHADVWGHAVSVYQQTHFQDTITAERIAVCGPMTPTWGDFRIPWWGRMVRMVRRGLARLRGWR